MKIINPDNTVEFTDADGDKLVCLRAPYGRAFGFRDEIMLTESGRLMGLFKTLATPELNKEVAKAEREAKAAKKEKKPEDKETKITTPALKLFQFKAVVTKMIIGKDTIEGQDDLVEAYETADSATAAWIDEHVQEIWDKAEPTEAKKKSRKS